MVKGVIFWMAAAVLCAASASSLSADQQAIIQSKLLTSGLSCIKDHPLTIAEIKVLKDKMLPDGKNAKCFSACLFKKIGVMDDMGKFNPDGVRKNAQQLFKNDDEHLMKVEEVITECSAVNDASTSDGNMGCDRAKLVFDCLTGYADKFGFNINF
ncbi:general odorant-binding protein 28a-like [Ostrinia furnacalis]|uniref:general odorant-binding protein 28a-like n=1 Tax=Ostrinia furnacalis TaxID=93504 RepID=UPI00103D140C|nr:general odorant-binding protein 28a-like [Ostrinia furnacalis]